MDTKRNGLKRLLKIENLQNFHFSEDFAQLVESRKSFLFAKLLDESGAKERLYLEVAA